MSAPSSSWAAVTTTSAAAIGAKRPTGAARTSSLRPVCSSARVWRPTKNMLMSATNAAPKPPICQATSPPTVVRLYGGPTIAIRPGLPSTVARRSARAACVVYVVVALPPRSRPPAARTARGRPGSARARGAARAAAACGTPASAVIPARPRSRRRSGGGTAPRASAACSSGCATPSSASRRIVSSRWTVSTSKRARWSSTWRSCTPGSWSRPSGSRSVSTVIDVRVRWRSSDSVPVSTVLPARMIVTRSHSFSTSARMWLESSTVRPCSRISSMQDWKTASFSGSRPEVGSSSTNSSASEASAATSATFWRLPFE